MKEYKITEDQIQWLLEFLPKTHFPLWLFKYVEIDGQLSKEITLPEIVHCKDCEYATISMTQCMRLDEWFKDTWVPIEPNGSCYWGEQR